MCECVGLFSVWRGGEVRRTMVSCAVISVSKYFSVIIFVSELLHLFPAQLSGLRSSIRVYNVYDFSLYYFYVSDFLGLISGFSFFSFTVLR